VPVAAPVPEPPRAPPPVPPAAPPIADLELPPSQARPGEISLPRNSPRLTFGSTPPPAPAAPAPELEPPSALPPARPRSPLDELLQRPSSAPIVAEAPIAPEAPPVPRMAAPLLIDVTPLSLRVETVGGYCDVLIAANTAVPCDRTRVFLTAADGQTTVIVRVAQGESSRFAENTFLGELELTGIAPAPRGETQIGVTFEIDADGILNVKARDMKTSRQTQARLQLLGAQTSAEDVADMMRRQKEHAVV
jgi:molecular chaperone DnaK